MLGQEHGVRTARSRLRRRLISGEVGRGTFVRSMEDALREPEESALIDLSVNSLFPTPLAEDLARRLGASGAPATLARRLDYQPHAGAPRHRVAGAAWLARRGLEASAERVIVTAGAQNGMAVAFLALARLGAYVLTDPMTYPGMAESASKGNPPARAQGPREAAH